MAIKVRNRLSHVSELLAVRSHKIREGQTVPEYAVYAIWRSLAQMRQPQGGGLGCFKLQVFTDKIGTAFAKEQIAGLVFGKDRDFRSGDSTTRNVT